MTNQELVNKADIALGDLSIAGRLNPEQTDRFVQTLIDQPTLLSAVRHVSMNSPEMFINKIGFGARIMRPAMEAAALADADRVKPDLGRVQLTTTEYIAEVHIPYDVLEDNIEGGNINVPLQTGAGGLHNTLTDLMAARAALDMEELAILGDTNNPTDNYLSTTNGYLKLATANVVNSNAPFDKNAVISAIKTLPTKYLRNRLQMQNFVSIDNETNARDMYASRGGALGDANLQGNLPIQLFGTQVTPVALMPGNQGLFTNPDNLIFGIQRNIMMEYDKDIRARVFIIVLTFRVGFAIEEVNAMVKYTGFVGSR